MSGAIDVADPFADPLTSFLIVLLIGVVAGFLFAWFAGPGWLSRQVSGSARGIATSMLVGVAGSFIGFHLAANVARSSSKNVHFRSHVQIAYKFHGENHLRVHALS